MENDWRCAGDSQRRFVVVPVYLDVDDLSLGQVLRGIGHGYEYAGGVFFDRHYRVGEGGKEVQVVNIPLFGNQEFRPRKSHGRHPVRTVLVEACVNRATGFEDFTLHDYSLGVTGHPRVGVVLARIDPRVAPAEIEQVGPGFEGIDIVPGRSVGTHGVVEWFGRVVSEDRGLVRRGGLSRGRIVINIISPSRASADVNLRPQVASAGKGICILFEVVRLRTRPERPRIAADANIAAVILSIGR